MRSRKVTPVAKANTAPPSKDKPFGAFKGADGDEQWLEFERDADVVTEDDFDFDQGKKWAERKAA